MVSQFFVVAVALVVALHFAFLAYVVVGGVVALRWPWTIGLHVPAVIWGVGIVALHWECPLTWLEQGARHHAGMAPLPPEGFIEHYITGVFYPTHSLVVVQVVVFAIVVASWVALAVTTVRGWRDGDRGLVPHHGRAR